MERSPKFFEAVLNIKAPNYMGRSQTERLVLGFDLEANTDTTAIITINKIAQNRNINFENMLFEFIRKNRFSVHILFPPLYLTGEMFFGLKKFIWF